MHVVIHQCEYEYASVDDLVVYKTFHSVDTDMVAHQCGYEYVSVDYIVL